MTYQLLGTQRLLSCLFVGLALLCSSANADVFIDGTTADLSLNDGVFVDAQFLDAAPNDFADNFLVWTSSETEKTSDGSTQLNQLDVINVNGLWYFRFAIDLQESGGVGEAKVTVTDLSVDVYDQTDTDFSDPTTIWSSADTLVFNDVTDPGFTELTATYTGNGADVVFHLPAELFAGTEFVGADRVKVTIGGLDPLTQDRNNGAEELVLYSGSNGFFIGDDDPANIPEPGSAGLVLLAFGITGVFNRRRR